MPTRLTCRIFVLLPALGRGLGLRRQQAGREGHLQLVDRVDNLLEADERVDGVVVVLEHVALGFGQHCLIGAGQDCWRRGSRARRRAACARWRGRSRRRGRRRGSADAAPLCRATGCRDHRRPGRRRCAVKRQRTQPRRRDRTAPQYASCAIVPPKESAASLWAACTLCQICNVGGIDPPGRFCDACVQRKNDGRWKVFAAGPGRVVTHGLTPHNRPGRLAMDASLANRVRSGRKQP